MAFDWDRTINRIRTILSNFLLGLGTAVEHTTYLVFRQKGRGTRRTRGRGSVLHVGWLRLIGFCVRIRTNKGTILTIFGVELGTVELARYQVPGILNQMVSVRCVRDKRG